MKDYGIWYRIDIEIYNKFKNIINNKALQKKHSVQQLKKIYTIWDYLNKNSPEFIVIPKHCYDGIADIITLDVLRAHTLGNYPPLPNREAVINHIKILSKKGAKLSHQNKREIHLKMNRAAFYVRQVFPSHFLFNADSQVFSYKSAKTNETYTFTYDYTYIYYKRYKFAEILDNTVDIALAIHDIIKKAEKEFIKNVVK